MMIHLQHSNFSTEQSPGALSQAGHTAAAVFLGFILVLGFLGNFLVLLVFSCFSVLRILANLLLVNISDMLVCIFGTPLSFTASVRGRWLTGSYGCQWYGFCNALFVIVSLVSLSLLSFERYSVLLCKLQSDSCQYRRAWLAVAASWLYALVWTLPPLLGWSRSVLDGLTHSANLNYSRPQRKFSRCLLHMIRCSSETPPIPESLMQLSNREMRHHAPNTSTLEQNTVTPQFTSREQQVGGERSSQNAECHCQFNMEGMMDGEEGELP
ncbi:melanopsin-A-like [Archocentrus centrarchus]|uniref:melanopsin-A-like n=1 Tax=Archocentrus centrarchus TaxID=63155 RepID=UPI0011E9E6BC|nr:melanopsin-A-like [Archocentrus centrarchus]